MTERFITHYSVEEKMVNLNMLYKAGTFLSVILAAFIVSCSPYPLPPETRVDDVVEEMHGISIPDPYHWLEDRKTLETQNWIDKQNRYAEEIVGETPYRNYVEERLRELMDIAVTPLPKEAGNYEYFSMRRPGEDLPIVYRRELPEDTEIQKLPIDPTEDFEIVLDPHGMSPENTTRFSIVTFNKNGTLMIYNERNGGEDELIIRVRDVDSAVDLPDSLPRSLYGTVFFSHDQKGFYYVKRSRKIGPRVMYHELGTEHAKDKLIFGEGYGPEQFINVKQVNEGRYLIFTVQYGWAKSEVFFQDMEKNGPIRTIVDDINARFYTSFIDGELFMRTDYRADKNRLLAVNLADPDEINWREVIPEDKNVMEYFVKIDDKFYVTYLYNGSNQIKVFEQNGTFSGEIFVPEFHRASIRAGKDKEAFVTVVSFTTPETTYRIDLNTGERTIWDQRQIDWSPENIIVEQVWRNSIDGTHVPMWVVHHKDVQLNGKNPTWLSGYGGFYVARKPSFNPTLALWLELGGVYALATLRGGSEFGESWHRDGMLLNKQHVFDDFISAAESLIDKGYTNPDKLVIQGGSNGGLLVGAALTQRPELFRAVICDFPDVDILRFPWYSTSNNAPALLEYGNSKIREQFEAIRKYSPYQNVRTNMAYPAVMFSTGDLDTRVPPSAAFKMAARLQASTTSGFPIILRYHHKAGHAAGRGLSFSRRIIDTAMKFTFVLQQLDVQMTFE